MKNFDSRTYSINDFLEWESNMQLELSPKFQRRSVWTDTARSFLMDTIIEGKPIPKVFVRQKLNTQTRKSIREVVDGQQRLRTILSFMKDGFTINKKHNSKYGGLYFSQLDQADEDIQAHILNYEISVDLLVNMSDSDVLDIFSRLNSYSVTLNDQEKINANHFSSFKVLADKVAHKHNSFWTKNKIIAELKVLRMEDVQMSADLLIAMIEGIMTKKNIKKQYALYEKEFEHDVDELEARFDRVINLIDSLFSGNLSKREFKRNHVFYSLFLAIYHLEFGVVNIDRPTNFSLDDNLSKVSQRLEHIDYIFEEMDKNNLSENDLQFLNDCRRATTDTSVRVRRSTYLIDLMITD
ncbi:protein of unknown function DUF262 [Shewanella halifaxensis HAW-EB4]|uniref:GmrSD restriction endonucleases N-terminal domain-containing protein n=1 Tax=Shewanella halifaxensis (strain HAW-EB4) TaxID=458817 RepID=B0TRQ4_SHEHH|nr:DUF262 domain-containing protein [Shewanella halifaxensis]ABZ77816.1 protein of unknown function DUF262 [Shewanella halifaxensis HAW-EB4]